MSVTRGTFLKSLGKAFPGMVFGGGIAVAHRLAGKLAAVTAEGVEPGTKSPSTSIAMTPRNGYIRFGPSEGQRIALTFDDGPVPGVTERLLDELGCRKMRATFFMIGEKVRAHPELARRVAAEGHEIGNHSFTHAKFSTLSADRVADEVRLTQEAIQEITGRAPVWFRPPFGELRGIHAGLVRAGGLEVVLWNVDPADWSLPGAEKVLEVVRQQAMPGAIIVCHEISATAGCTGEMLDILSQKCLTVSSLSELLGPAQS